MTLQTKNIIVGAAEIFMSRETSLSSSWGNPTQGAKVPQGTSGQSLTSDLEGSADWRNAGYTNGGVDFTYTPTYGEVTVDQLLDAAKMFKSKMTATVKTTLEEATLENLMVSWAQDPIGGDGQAKTYYANGPTAPGNDLGLTDSTGFPVNPDGSGSGVALNTGDEQLGIAAGALGIEPVERQMVFVGVSPRTVDNKKRERAYHLRRVLNVTASTHSLKRDAQTEFPVEFRLLPTSISGAEYGTIRDRVITTA